MMKKISILVSLMLAFATSSFAEVATGTIQWLSAVGVYQHDPSSTSFDTFDDDAILNNYDVLWQLILSPATTAEEAVIHAPDFSASNYLSGGDTLVVDNSGKEAVRLGGLSYFLDEFAADASLYTGIDDLDKVSIKCDLTVGQAYYMYQRVYQLEKGETVPSESTWYWDSGMKEVKFDGKVNSVSFAVELDQSGNIDEDNMISPNLQAIPEPATMSLLGLGALAMVLRRKLRK
jgi:hypothetical protein